MVNLDKLVKGTDWILEERKLRRKDKAKQSKHVPVDEDTRRARDMLGRPIEIFDAGTWRGAVVKSFSAEAKQVLFH